MTDCEPLVKKNNKFKHDNLNRNDVGGMLISVGNTIQWKKVILLWLLFILMNTEIFIDKCIAMFDDSVVDGTLSMKGTFIMSLLLVISYIFIDLLYG